MPNYSIRSVQNAAIDEADQIRAGSLAGAAREIQYRRTALNPKITAKQMKRNPITSFHRVRAGFRTAGTTCLTNSRASAAPLLASTHPHRNKWQDIQGFPR